MKKMSRKILTLSMAGLLTLAPLFPAFADKVEPVVMEQIVIRDIARDAWYEDAIVELAEKGILQGNKGLIKPNANLTRAEYVQILYNIMGDKWEEAIHPDLLPGSMDDIKDVKEGDWFFKQIRIAMMNGIIKDGYDGRLRPNDTLTREEMFVMTVRAFSLEHWEGPEGPEDRAKNFKDESNISTWSRDSINFLLEGSFIKGNQENKLLPKNKITRAEAAMLISAMKEVKDLEPKKSVITK